MFDSKTEVVSHQYNDGLTNTKRLIVMTEFILQMSYEEQYVDFCKRLLDKNEWSDFHKEIRETICEYEITPEEVQHAINTFIKVKPIVC